MAPEKLPLLTTCPTCQSTNVKIIDKHIKRVIRLILGSNRYLCKNCRTTWRRNEPHRAAPARRKREILPFREEGEWKSVVLPAVQWNKIVKELEKTIEHLLSTNSRFIVIDISLVQSFDTTCFSTIIKLHKICKESGTHLRFANASPEVKDIFKLTSLDFLLS